MTTSNHPTYYAVIMAGGGGTRLWPLSRQARPKQMLRLIDERSLFQTSVERLAGVFSPEQILVVTVAEQAEQLRIQCPAIPEENFLIEPMPRGTASVIGLAAVALKQRNPDSVMAVLTSDHFIGNEAGFRQLLQVAYKVAQDNYLVTLGITPTFPATGYGYIQRGDLIGNYEQLNVYTAERFQEKPDEVTAQKLLAQGDHDWNSGMFVWRVDRILDEFHRQMPDLASQLDVISAAWEDQDKYPVIQSIWPNLENQTIDYGIMEGAHKVAVIPAGGLKWSDVGSWDSLFEVLPTDEYGNIVMGGQHIGVETHESLVYMNQDRRLIVTIGVEDLIVVDTGDVVLVCRKDQAQKVRQVVSHLKQNGENYL